MSTSHALKPCNRFVLVTPIDNDVDEEAKPTILVPDTYKVKSSPYGVYQLEQISNDCKVVTPEDLGRLLLVNDNMVETASLEQGDFLLVQENHIYGIL
jgi:hypothetical protein